MSGRTLKGTLGRYAILEKIGEGGMGAVYLAEDTRLRRKVALKVPHLTLEDRTALERFRREAAMAASIDHPHLCPVLDLDEIGEVKFFTMPYLEGTPLARLIERGRPWPIPSAIELIRKVASGIAYLHARGIIHRDLKPSNVMVRPTGEPVVMDFGLARDFSSDETRLTCTGMALGTPPYMPPEQLSGQKDVGVAADVYGVGLLLYELLTARLPFESKLPAVLYTQIMHELPTPPSLHNAAVQPRLDALCLKALRKDPAERQKSIEVFAVEMGMAAAAYSLAGLHKPALPPAAASPPTLAPSHLETPARNRCPKCGQALLVPRELVGQTVKCPRCGFTLGRVLEELLPTEPPAPDPTAPGHDLPHR